MVNLSFESKLKNMAIGAYIAAVKKQKKVLISDTTLRDGEQAPGASLYIEQKLTIARQLERLGVDAIESGFPASSSEDFEAARLISQQIKRPVISALSRCNKDDIAITADALKGARRRSLALFIGTSPYLRQYSLNKSQDQVIDIMKEAIAYAKRFSDAVTFGAEDASRTEPEFLYRVYEEAINSGALVIGFTDTVGWLVPHEVKSVIDGIQQNVKNLDKAFLGIHFHNDLGLAVANSLAASQSHVKLKRNWND